MRITELQAKASKTSRMNLTYKINNADKTLRAELGQGSREREPPLPQIMT